MPKPFTLIVCTYMRPKPLLNLLESVNQQTLYPNEILIVDGSTNNETETIIKKNAFKNLNYFKVEEQGRGLTKQRNFGIKKVSPDSEIICFLDDDTVLEKSYFENLIGTYEQKQEALAVGGYISNEVNWEKADGNQSNPNKFYFDGWMREEPSRFKLRRKFGLQPDTLPGFLPSFGHGRSIGFFPPSGKIYEVEQIMGGVSSYKKEVFQKFHFSTYFEGYGLYEDADFSLRVAKIGKLYLNTAAQLGHYHNESGRPNKFKYGKMVVRNGWYVWRVKYPLPNLKARLKWNATVGLLTFVRLINTFTTRKRKAALTEGLGRIVGWCSILIDKPKM
ncbi:glycosyltransferase [Tamlana crocina]|uniref:Glycosyltransferase family 2 protein n=1 Tax=Tamlana crocina TaxID=393006 RepID=A0ABX1D9L8_9FLAO|nr:glycosyltransferase [Tamlana crocina]NJX15054.1 glycosyltransferase family 2 protein [Tamlana crocina]